MEAYEFPDDVELAGETEELFDRAGHSHGALKYVDLNLVWRPRGSSSVYYKRFVPKGGAEIRDVCAYRFDQAMGFGYVPKTIWREHEGAYGSLQAWLPGQFVPWDPPPDNDPIQGRPSLQRVGEETAVELWLLDAVLMNVDSVWTNYLWCEQTEQAARIDNRECLPPPEFVVQAKDPPASQYNWPLPWWRGLLHGRPLPESLLGRLAAIDWPGLIDGWCALGLEEAAGAAAEGRARTLLKTGIVDTEALWGLRDPYQ